MPRTLDAGAPGGREYGATRHEETHEDDDRPPDGATARWPRGRPARADRPRARRRARRWRRPGRRRRTSTSATSADAVRAHDLGPPALLRGRAAGRAAPVARTCCCGLLSGDDGPARPTAALALELAGASVVDAAARAPTRPDDGPLRAARPARARRRRRPARTPPAGAGPRGRAAARVARACPAEVARVLRDPQPVDVDGLPRRRRRAGARVSRWCGCTPPSAPPASRSRSRRAGEVEVDVPRRRPGAAARRPRRWARPGAGAGHGARARARGRARAAACWCSRVRTSPPTCWATSTRSSP